MRRNLIREICWLLLLTAAAIAINGYHAGFQDGATYFAAIKQWLDPSLYPWDAIFFLALTRYSVFVPLVADSSRLTGLSVDATVFLWHLVSIFLLLLACRRLARSIFPDLRAQWGAVLAVWGALLLPVAGTGLSLTERYLHPRDLAAACVLFALAAALDGRLTALAWLAAAAVIHPTMAMYGAFHVAVQTWKRPQPAIATALMPLGVPIAAVALLSVPNPAWYAIVSARHHLYPLHWYWYEWLGALAPLALLELIRWTARRDGNRIAAHVAGRAALVGVLATVGALMITTVPALVPLVPLEPMRTLQLVSLLFVFLSGGLLRQHILRDRWPRWAFFVVLLVGAFYAADRIECPASSHIEWPGRPPRNAWLKAFLWVRANTPRGALFALDPYYMEHPGEDVHGFRAFAERSTLADWTKDRGNAQINPEMAFAWQQQFRAREHWPEFGAADFARLKKQFGVSWVMLEQRTPLPAGLDCPYARDGLLVCRLE